MSSKPENLAAMTVNERLFARGLLEDFDRARAAGDMETLRAIFAQIELPDYPVEDLLD